MTTDSRPNLALSIEASLGRIKQIYPFYSKNKESKFHVAEFTSNCERHAHLQIFGTIGLSEYVQYSPKDDRPIQKEFTMIFDKWQDCDWIIGILADIGYRFLSKLDSVGRGDVIGPFGPIHSSTAISGFYATAPFFLDEDKMMFDIGEDRRPLYWLIPIYDSEFDFLKSKGWRKFEGLLEQNVESLGRLDRVNLSPPPFKYSDVLNQI